MSSPSTDLQLLEGAASNPTPWSIQPFVAIGSPVERFQIADGNNKGVLVTISRERAELIVAAVNAYEANTARLSELEAEVARLREVCQAQSTEHRIHIRQMQKNHSDELALFSSSLGALREAAQTAIGLLQEKKHGSPARSPGHNAQVVLRAALESQS